MPAGEAAYTAQVFPPLVSYFNRLDDAASHISSLPVGSVASAAAAYIFPSLNRSNCTASRTARIPSAAGAGVGLRFFCRLNYRGIRLSASSRMDNGDCAPPFAVLLGISGVRGPLPIFRPAFSGTPSYQYCSLPDVPYFMTGFESAPKAAEEAHPDFLRTGFFRAMWMLFSSAQVFTSRVAAVATSALARFNWKTICNRDRIRASAGSFSGRFD